MRAAELDDGKHRIGRTGGRIYPEQRRVRAHEIEVRLAIEGEWRKRRPTKRECRDKGVAVR